VSTVRIRNVNPLGQVDLPLIGRQQDPVGETGSGCLEPGEEFDVAAEHAKILLEQVGNYERVIVRRTPAKRAPKPKKAATPAVTADTTKDGE
jgi:hypothetical protein